MKRLLWLVPAAAGGLLLWSYQGRRAPKPEEGHRTDVATAAASVAAPEPQRSGDASQRVEASRMAIARVLDAQTQRSGARLSRAHTIAVVNGTALKASDLFAWHRGESERELSADMLAFLLQRAVVRELVFQAARSEGIALGEAELRSVDELRANPGMRDPDDVEFEARDLTAQLLLAELAARAGVAPPFATSSDVKAYYRQNAEAFESLPSTGPNREAAWERIEAQIRQKLASEQQQRYREEVDALVRDLAAKAKISGA